MSLTAFVLGSLFHMLHHKCATKSGHQHVSCQKDPDCNIEAHANNAASQYGLYSEDVAGVTLKDVCNARAHFGLLSAYCCFHLQLLGQV